MAVYTKISDDTARKFLQSYNIGNLVSLKAIEAGVENTNYFLDTDGGRYIFTIYEKRVDEKDLPFYINLMGHLSGNNFPCPVPIKNKKGEALAKIEGKPCAIVSFLEGKDTKTIQNEHVMQLGQSVAKMHLAAKNFSMFRDNSFSLDSWFDIFDSVKEYADNVKSGLAEEIEKNLFYISKNWPTHLPSGIVHADLFPDNVFFQDNRLAGIIDFYFACNDALMYDLAICLNSWCFELEKEFNITKAKLLLSSYDKVRAISKEELEALPVLASGAALRFLLTRLYDWLNVAEDALVRPKNPLEYLHKLRFHNGIKSHKEYGL